MAKKGLSYEEKRKRMLEFFYEKKEVFSQKELEQMLPKSKGIVFQSVKEVLFSLRDDGLVDNDKIGSGQFFWALPSKAGQTRQVQIDKLQKQLDETKEKKADLHKRKREALDSRTPNADRKKKLARFSESKNILNELDQKLSKFATSDPERIKKLDQGAQVCKQAANRWTDNIHCLLSFYKSKRPETTEVEFYKYFDLPADFDELS